MSYICQSCIDEYRLEPKPLAQVSPHSNCEICWRQTGPLVWVRVLNMGGRGHGPDKEWMERVKNRPEGMSMNDVTDQILAEDAITLFKNT